MFYRRRLGHGFANIIGQTVDDAAGARKNRLLPGDGDAASIAGTTGKPDARSNPRAVRGPRIGRGLARGKDKRDYAERRDKCRSIGHGTHLFIGY